MTTTEFVIWFIFMAVAVMTILVVGTLGAAGMLHRPHRPEAGGRPHGSHAGERPDADASRHKTDVEDARVQLGSGSANSAPVATATTTPGTDNDEPPHGRAA